MVVLSNSEKEQSISNSQARGGQITIKIQNPGQYLLQTNPIPANQMRTIQQKYVQHINQDPTGTNSDSTISLNVTFKLRSRRYVS